MLHSERDEKREEVADVIRSLINVIILTPSDNGLQIALHGNRVGILTITFGAQKSRVPSGPWRSYFQAQIPARITASG